MGQTVENRLAIFGSDEGGKIEAVRQGKKQLTRNMKSKQKYESTQTNSSRSFEKFRRWDRGEEMAKVTLHEARSSDLLRMILDTKRGMDASTAAACGRVDGASALHSKNSYKNILY